MSWLDGVNNIVVLFDDLWRVAEESEQLHKSGKGDFEALMFMIACLFKGEPQKAEAVLLRMQALMRLLEEEGAPGWTLPKQPDGAIPTQEWVFAAAAVQPLIGINNDAQFEREPFLEKVLELAESEGNA